MRISRFCGAGALALAILAVPAQTSAEPAGTGKGFSEIAGCISGADNLLISIVVDESLSLRSTDPSALRVQGITTAIDSLEQLTATVDDSTRVEVSLSTFARSYETLIDWRKLDGQAAERMRVTAERVLPARDAGNATDYRQALLGAKRQLDTRQHQLDDPNACKLLLWFTDGALDVDAATSAAAQQLCQSGGIVDAVREAGISVVALALFTPGAGVSEHQRDQLRAVAEGRGGDATCGTSPIPADSATGVYLLASDPAALQRLFAGAGALVAGGTEVSPVTCPGSGCAGGVYPLIVDQGVAGARVLVQTSGSPEVAITSPSGQRLVLSSGDTRQVDGAELSYLVRDHLATINLSFSPYSERRSRWLLKPSGPSQLSVYLFWGASLSLDTTQVRAGATSDVIVRVLDQDGGLLPPGLFRGAKAALRVDDREVGTRLGRDGTIRGQVKLGVDDLPSNVTLTASLTVRSIPGNVSLGPITVTKRVPVLLPPSYPSLAPQELDFGELKGIGTSKAELKLTGSHLGPTTVCLLGSSVIVPGNSPAPDLVRAEENCVELEADETKTLQLELSPGTSADGIARGEVKLQMSAADRSEDLTLDVPVRLQMERTVDQGTRWELIAALVLLALLIPALLLVGSNLLLARFVMTSMSRTAVKPVKVTPTGLQPLNGSALLEPEDFDNAPFSGVRRGGRLSIEHAGIALKARRIFSLNDPEGVAIGPAGQLLVSSAMPCRGQVPHEAPVALGEVDAAFVIVNQAGATPEEASGTLVMCVPEGVDRHGIQARAARMSSAPDWRKVLVDLSEGPSSRQESAGGPPASAGPIAAPTPTPNFDEPPPMPWDQPHAGGRAVPPSNSAKKPRFSKSRKPASSPPSDGDSIPASDDTLPPLPDFLK